MVLENSRKVVCEMGKEEFIKKAIEMGYTQKQIDEIIQDNEKDIALGIPVDWSMYLIEFPIIN